ncbi:hypothetical protein SCLCIDRAFT_139862, partial [Scleroderma citrinum Foug A]
LIKSELLEKAGDKSGIPYLTYHHFYQKHLLSSDTWAHDVLNFFNSALFPDSSSTPAILSTSNAPVNDWETELELAMREGHPVDIQGGEPGVSTPGITLSASAPPHSISAAMQGLEMHDNAPETSVSTPRTPVDHPTDRQQDPPAIPDPPAPQPKPKPRPKKQGKQAAADADAEDGVELTVSEGTCRNRRSAK